MLFANACPASVVVRMSNPMPEVFTDSLDVTFSPDDYPRSDVNAVLLDVGFVPTRTHGSDSQLYQSPSKRGTVKVDIRSTFARVSTSGASCADLRASSAWLHYLSALSSSPHCVTRLDAALDLSMDGADLVDAMRARHPKTVGLGRKPIKTSVILSTRDDGRESGTWYAGYGSSARATAKVYDKALQMLQRFGEVIPPRARVEVTAWKGYGATLRDAALPQSIFWHIASPALIQQVPEGVPMWQPNTDGGWDRTPRSIEPAQVIRSRVESSAELARLVEIASEMPGGEAYLLHQLRQQVSRLFAQARSSQAPEDLAG